MKKSFPLLALLTFATNCSFCFAWNEPVEAEGELVEGQAVVSEFEQRLMSFDSNLDGLIQKEELPVVNRERFDVWDQDQNGVLDEREQGVLFYYQKNGELPAYKMRPQKDSDPAGDKLVLVDGFFRSSKPRLTVGEFVGRALTFDSNNDGALDKNELMKMADAFVKVDRINQSRQRQSSRISVSNNRSARVSSHGQNSHLSKLHAQVRLPTYRSVAGRNAVRSGST